MVVVSSTLKVSEVTFIIRIVVQVLAYGGFFLLTFIILGAAPRIAPVETHDILNRIIGQATYTTSSFKWLYGRVKGRGKDRLPSLYLGIAVFLFLIYTLFVSVSDIGLLGFYQCDVPFPNSFDFAASVKSDQDAIRVVKSNFLYNDDPSNIRSFQCNSARVENVTTGITMSVCQDWHNSTFGDSQAFASLNSTDSDVFIPRRLAVFPRKDGVYTNTYVRRIEGARTKAPMIRSGLAVEPHETGVRIVPGVPQLSPNQKVVIPRTIAIEADVGCMSLGIVALRAFGGHNDMLEDVAFHTNGTWRKYAGPDYLYDVLAKSVDEVRALVRPLFNESAVDARGIINDFNSSFLNEYRLFDRVSEYFLPGASIQGTQILSNCTQRLHQQLGVTPPPVTAFRKPDACNFLQLGGSTIEGSIYKALSKHVCATATHVNMVDATVQTNSSGYVSISLNRLPSTLNTVDANMWLVVNDTFGDTAFGEIDGLLRYTLSDDPAGPTKHFIYQEGVTANVEDFVHGIGNPGLAISHLGARMIHVKNFEDSELLLGTLDTSYYGGEFKTERLTRWAGEMGASWMLGSVGYNGWAARNLPQLTIVSIGGKTATCFHMAYGFALLPLFLAAVVSVLWMIGILFRSSYSKIGVAKEVYGGMEPYNGTVSSQPLPPGTLLLWEKEGQPHLEVLYDGRAVEGHKGETLLEYMKDKSSCSS